MIDMRYNRVPYGLLTDEEKAALDEHKKAGGKLKHWDDDDAIWVDNNSFRFYSRFIYRTVPLPLTQDEIAWDRLPDWVEWVASGTWVVAFEYEPSYANGAWSEPSGKRRRIDDFPGIIIKRGTCDWKDGKQQRPR